MPDCVGFRCYHERGAVEGLDEARRGNMDRSVSLRCISSHAGRFNPPCLECATSHVTPERAIDHQPILVGNSTNIHYICGLKTSRIHESILVRFCQAAVAKPRFVGLSEGPSTDSLVEAIP